jgi:hypothetical protein
LVINSFIDGLESQYDAVKESLGGLSKDMAGMQMAAPGIPGSVHGIIGRASAVGAYPQKVLNYYAAPGSSLGSEEDLFEAAERARMVGW